MRVLPVQVVPLGDDPGVRQQGVGDAGDDDAAGGVVDEVDALAEFAAADGDEDGLAPLVDLLLVGDELLVVPVLVLVLDEYLPPFLGQLLEQLVRPPHFLDLLQHAVGRQENEDTPLGHLREDPLEGTGEGQAGVRLVAETEGLRIAVDRAHGHEHLLRVVDYVLVLELDRERGLQLALVGVQRGKSPTREDHCTWLLVDQGFECERRVEAP